MFMLSKLSESESESESDSESELWLPSKMIVLMFINDAQ